MYQLTPLFTNCTKPPHTSKNLIRISKQIALYTCCRRVWDEKCVHSKNGFERAVMHSHDWHKPMIHAVSALCKPSPSSSGGCYLLSRYISLPERCRYDAVEVAQFRSVFSGLQMDSRETATASRGTDLSSLVFGYAKASLLLYSYIFFCSR